MKDKFMKTWLGAAALAAGLLAQPAAHAATVTVNLTAQRTAVTLPDGATVPMWGYCPTGTACTGWKPGPTIVAAPGDTLQITLTNQLPAPTSIVILGQLGGGLGQPVKVASPAHATVNGTTFPAIDPTASFTPPAQGPRARSFVPEAAVGGTATYTWQGLKPGTYLYETGTQPSIQAPMGLYGLLVVTTAPVAPTPGVAYGNAVTYDADVALLFSEIDPVQNAAVDKLAAAQCGTGGCTGTIADKDYPPAVNYSPLYYLINGQAFDPSNPAAASYAVNAPATSGNVLLRMANAGLRSHTPSVSGLNLVLVAEDGNLAPGKPKVQSEVLMAAGKTFDALINPPSSAATYSAATFTVFDRQLGLSTGSKPIGGMRAYIKLNGGSTAGVAAVACAANADSFTVPPNTPSLSGNVLANDIGVINVQLTAPVSGLTLNSDGSFTYAPTPGPVGATSFQYTGSCTAGGAATGTVTIAVSGTSVPTTAGTTINAKSKSLATLTQPGLLDKSISADPANLALKASLVTTAGTNTCGSVNVTPSGAVSATPGASPASCSFQYIVTNSQGTPSAPATVSVNFPAGNGPQVTVVDSVDRTLKITDYRWTLEEDRTLPPNPADPTKSLGVSFHASHMPVVAAGCTGPRSCANATTAQPNAPAGVIVNPPSNPVVLPSDVQLDPGKRYFLSILPADAADGDPADPVNTFGHSMSGGSVVAGQTVTFTAPRNPLPPAQLSIYVFEENIVNGAPDGGETGLGGFTVTLFDTRGQVNDVAGQVVYDIAGMPMTNALMGTPDCPGNAPVGQIITCPDKRADGTPSPLAGMALVKNLIPGRLDVWVTPGAERAGRGEKWIQVSTLEGTHANDSFTKPGEPPYWQEFGSPGFHASVGFVNPDRVNARGDALAGKNTVTGVISGAHMDRPTFPGPNGLTDTCSSATGPADDACRAAMSYTTCYVALNGSAGSTPAFRFAQCDALGNFRITGVPDGTHQLAIFDEWLDQIIGYKTFTVNGGAAGTTLDLGHVQSNIWFTRIEQSAYMDLNGNGVRDANEPGIQQIPMNVRFRDGSISNVLFTDGNGMAVGNEVFPLFNWYVVESDTTRFKTTAINVTYDAGGKVDATGKYAGILNSKELFPLPPGKQYPGATYFTGTTTRIDPPTVWAEGWQGFINSTAYLDWGKRPYNVGENGGITGMVYYANTRGIDDPRFKPQNLWEPGIPRVKVNLYRQSANPDGTTSRVLVDTTTTSSWDDYAPGMNCPGQDPNDVFSRTLGYDPANPAATGDALYKCYDGIHNFNQVQPAVYDGRYFFPSKGYVSPATGKNQLDPGQYVVEVVLPEGYQIMREEDKNLFNGDPWVAPPVTQFAGVGNVFILPDQATLNDRNIPGGGSAFPPCVGDLHRVPDVLNEFPDTAFVTPFAGQDRPLCDKKLVTLGDQMQATADFQAFTWAPIAGHVVGIMLNDASAENDKYSPVFGEKQALPNAPISVRDFNGVEIARWYNDKWGTFNGLTVSSNNANVPNPSGWEPNMLTFCMNDPGPIPDPANPGKLIIDPAYNPQFSNFCYVWPMMPGNSTYLDTPVLPVSAFATASTLNPVDCQYPDATPAIKRVDGAGIGPWLTPTRRTLTITALGTKPVLNPAYEGPLTTSGLGSQQKINRNYSFGAAAGTVTLGGRAVPAANVTWTDQTITVIVPATGPNAFGPGSYELGIVAANGKKSVDTVTVTIQANETAPVVVKPSLAAGVDQTAAPPHPIQDAIDAAKPGDLIIVDEGSYPELVIMWKPVRLQGVGAASVVINASKYPNRKLDDWRNRINQLFGVQTFNNTPNELATGAVVPNPQIDPLPGQTINGGLVNLVPTVLGTEEGAGITVLAKRRAPGVVGCNSTAASSYYDANGIVTTATTRMADSIFDCPGREARIDGITVTGGDSGGGIYVNGWAHGLEISNNRVYGNAGVLHGGVRVGQPNLEGQTLRNRNNGLGYNRDVNIHHNAITTNGMHEGQAAAGAVGVGGAGAGVSICSGTDNYRVNYNFICGNYSSSDGGGFGHIGMSMNGQLTHNQIVFNESYNQTGPQHGGGIAIEGELDPAGGLTLGTGDVLVDSNLIQGNLARAGSGGGVRLAMVNGQDARRPQPWKVTLSNNFIVNNVAGWAGAGVSLSDALHVDIVNNTIASNDAVGITGNLFNTAVGGGANTGPRTTVPSPAGVSTELTSPALVNFFPPAQRSANNVRISDPALANNVIWQNRSFFYNSAGESATLLPSNNWADAVAAAKPAPLPAQTATGQCVNGAKYWDLGVVGVDQNPTPGALQLHPVYSVLTSTVGYAAAGAHNTSNDPRFAKQYCNGSLLLPDAGFEPAVPFQLTFNINVGQTLDEGGNFVDVRFGPISLTNPANPSQVNGDYTLASTASGAFNRGGNVLNLVTATPPTAVIPPTVDYFGTSRPQAGVFDIGAHELVPPPAPIAQLSATSLGFGTVLVNGSSAAQTVTLANAGTAALTYAVPTVSGPFAITANTCTGGSLAAPVPPAASSCTVTVVFKPIATGAATGTLSFGATNDAAAANPLVVSLGGTGFLPSLPTLPVLDNFNRANANTLGASWNQIVLLGAASIRVNGNQALDSVTPGAAYWATALGATANQAAAFTFASTPTAGSALVLRATGGSATIPLNFVRVRLAAGAVVIESTTNASLSFTAIATLTGSFANGDTLSATIDGNGLVAVFKTSGATTTLLGAGSAPASFAAAGGRIGMQLPLNQRVDNFAGGTF